MVWLFVNKSTIGIVDIVVQCRQTDVINQESDFEVSAVSQY